MPHVIVEFTHGLASEPQIESMLDALHTAIAATGLFDTEHIRLRALPLHHYRCGGIKRHFLHAQLRIHTGRTAEQKQRLSNAVLASLKDQCWPAEVITVEIVEMDKASYSKFYQKGS